MDEIVAGNVTPVSVTEMKSILDRYLPRIDDANVKAAALRRRVADGDNKIRHAQATGVDLATIQDAEARLEALKLSLREEEAWQCAGLGMALAEAVASVLAGCAEKDGWNPPPRSMLRIVLPGIANLAVELKK